MPSVSQAKNIMCRVIKDIIDPPPTKGEINSLWEYFEYSCAYCGEKIDRPSRKGHIDHLDSNGSNGIKNRVLACATCNGDYKRDKSWEDFIEEKYIDDTERAEKRDRIIKWMNQHQNREVDLTPKAERALNEARQIIEQFHAVCTKLRLELKNK